MPRGLKRFQRAESLHFITFSCFHRLPLLEAPDAREMVETVLEAVRARHEARVYAYVSNSPLSLIDLLGLDDCGPVDTAAPGGSRVHAMLLRSSVGE